MRRFLMLSLAGCTLMLGHALAAAQTTTAAVNVSPGVYQGSGRIEVGNSLQGCNWAFDSCKSSCSQQGLSYLYCRKYCLDQKNKCLKGTAQPFPKGG